MGNSSPHAPELVGGGSVRAMAACEAGLPPAYWLVDCPLDWPLYCPLYCPLLAALDRDWANSGLVVRDDPPRTIAIARIPNLLIALAQLLPLKI